MRTPILLAVTIALALVAAGTSLHGDSTLGLRLGAAALVAAGLLLVSALRDLRRPSTPQQVGWFPGPELDAAVEHCVWGRTTNLEIRHEGGELVAWAFDLTTLNWLRIPPYSTDAASASLVREELARRGISLDVSEDDPHAVCLAAIAAVGEGASA